MDRYNFSDNIHASGRKLHLQTNTLQDETKIVSTLFDGGRVLSKEEHSYDAELSGDLLKQRVETHHFERMADIEFLYSISSRVKTVRHPLSLNKLGLQFLKWNLLDEAISEFELALHYDSKYGEVYMNLGEAYLRRGGLEEALQIVGKGLQVAPTYADMWQKFGVVHFRMKQYKKALDAFQKALKINPSFDEPHLHSAQCLLEIVLHDKHEKDLPGREECIRQTRDHLNRAAALSIRFQIPGLEEALRELHQGDLTQTSKLLQKIGQELPKIVDLDFHDLFYLHLMYGEKGRNRKAVQKYVERLETLVREYPRYPDVHNKLGIGYLIQCRNLFNRALNEFQQACDMNPKYERAKNNLKLAKNESKGLLLLLRAILK